MPEATLNKNYVIEEDQKGQAFPAIQANDYQPKNTKVEIKMGLSEESLNLLDSSAVELLAPTPEQVFYGESEVSFFAFSPEVRWVIVGRPSLFVLDKESGEYSQLERGMKLAGTKKVTVSKLFLCCVCNGELILNAEGNPQIFTLNLKSSKTTLIGNYKSQPGDGTIASLNTGLAKHYQAKGWLTHLVSVGIKAIPEKFTSKTGDSTVGIKFVLEAGAKPLTEQQQQIMFELARDPETIEMIKDPFGLKSKTSGATEASSSNQQQHASEDDMSVDYDEIPF